MSRTPGRAGGPAAAVGRVPVVLALAVALAAAVVLDRNDPDRDGDARRRDRPGGPVVPSGDELSVSWYCAEGTAAPDERAAETVLVANLGREDADAVVSVLDGAAAGAAGRRQVSVPALGQVEVAVADVAPSPERLEENGTVVGPGVIVEVFGGRAVVEHTVARGDDIAMGPCAREPAREWFFGGGTTRRGAQQVLALFNPFGDDAVVDVTFLTDEGVQTPPGVQGLVVPRRSRLAVPVHDQVRRQEQVATAVRARTGRFVAEQSLSFEGSEDPPGIGLTLGVTAAARTWSLPFGSVGDDAGRTVSVANFGTRGTEVEVAALLEGDETVAPEAVAVPGRSVATVDVGTLAPANAELAVEVRAVGETPVVVDVLATGTGGGAALEAGIPRPARRWAFAGPDDVDADAVISVVNPGREPLTASLLAYVAGDLDSPRSAPERALPPGERATFSLADLDVDPDQVVVVEATGPVYVARLLVTESVRSLDAGVPFSDGAGG